MTQFLCEWQTLVGAVLGGIFALLVALVVARDARKRDERAAAYFLISQLKAFELFAESMQTLEGRANRHLETLGKLRQTPQHWEDLWRLNQVIEHLRIRPRLTDFFEGQAARVIGIDPDLAVEISTFAPAARAAEGLLAPVEDALIALHKEHLELINKGAFPTGGWGYDQVLPSLLQEARAASQKAQRSLQELVLDSSAWHNRFQRKMRRIEALRDEEIGTPRG